MRNNNDINEQHSGNGSISCRNDDNRQNTEGDEFILRRRWCFLLLSIFPFVISAMALCIVLMANSPPKDPIISNLESSAASLRGKPDRNETSSLVETSHLEDSGTTPSKNVVEVNNHSSLSISPSSTASESADISLTDPSATTSAFESSFLTTTTTVSPTYQTTTSLPQNLTASSSSVPTTKVAVETTAHAPPSSTSASYFIIRDTTTTAQHECEEALTREECSSSDNCVWFVPVNWSELCFTKPDFSLSECKEVRLDEECFQAAVGCSWVIERWPGRGNDICRYAIHSELRGGAHKRQRL